MSAERGWEPERAARETLSRLRVLADPSRAASCQRYFKDPVDVERWLENSCGNCSRSSAAGRGPGKRDA